MANLETHPHLEDVIFNKPSLKEFVRLIKNGTVHEIWPSTQDQFNKWNAMGKYEGQEPGYTPYLNPDKGLTVEKLKLKSVNTSITIFYGDHEDTTTSSSIDIDKTQNDFNLLKSKVENNNNEEPLSIQEKIIQDNFFNSLEDLGYPQLKLNIDTGAINQNEIIDYKQTAKNNYLKNEQRWIALKTLIEDFKPTEINIQYNIEDKDNLTLDYFNYFDNQENGINIDSYIRGLKNETYNLEEIKTSDTYSIIDIKNNYFSFANILKVIDNYKNKIEKKNEDEYIDGINYLLSNAKEPLIDTTQLNEKAQQVTNTVEQYENLLYNSTDENNLGLEERFKKLKNYIYNDHQILFPYIINYSLSHIENNNQSYEELISFVEQYRILNNSLSIIENLGAITQNELQRYNELIDYITQRNSELAEDLSNKDKVLNEQITMINSYIDYLNNMIKNLKNNNIGTTINNILFNYQIPTLKYSYLPADIYGLTNVISNVQNYYNIIIAELEIKENYDIIPIDNLNLTLQEYKNYMANITNIIENQLLGTEEQKAQDNFISPLLQAQRDVFIQLDNFLKEYIMCLQNFAEKGFSCIIPYNTVFEVDEETGQLKNKEKFIEDLTNQYNKSVTYFNIVQIIFPKTDISALTKLFSDYQTLKERIEEIKITIIKSGNPEQINNWIKENFKENEITTLIIRLTNKPIEEIEVQKYIPIASQDYLSINTKELCDEYQLIYNDYISSDRSGSLEKYLKEINNLVSAWTPSYDSTGIEHYVCINVGSFIEFDNESTVAPYNGSITISVDEVTHYPLINGLTDNISSTTQDSEIATIKGLKSILGENFNKIGTTSAGGEYQSIYLKDGEFLAAKVIAGASGTLKDNKTTGWKVTDTSGSEVSIQAIKVFGAVYNDYAEYRNVEANPGRCIIENGDGTLSLSTSRLQLGANIVSDTYGFVIGEMNNTSCPVAVCGRVLAHPLESKEIYHPGAAVCSGPEGTVSLMSREEIREWPDAIVGYVSEVPTYDTWGTDNVPVNGRIWIKIK